MNVFWSTPTMSRPRSWIDAIVDPTGMAPGAGCAPGLRLASRSPQGGFTASGATVISCAPAGLTGAGATDTDAGGVGDAPHPASAATTATTTATTRGFTGTPAAGATVRRPRPPR